jgi:hypothetical protein
MTIHKRRNSALENNQLCQDRRVKENLWPIVLPIKMHVGKRSEKNCAMFRRTETNYKYE